MQTIKINKKTRQEYPVSIRCGWPDILAKGKGKARKYPSRSKLLGNREIDCRVIVAPPKRIENKLNSIRAEIQANKLKRARFSVLANNPEIKVGPVHNGAVQPRQNGKFLKKIVLA